jgi:succinate dehydrogenase (ubiquinone) membrane anchor subunit
VEGSYHWNAERSLSLLTIPLLTTSFFAPYPYPLVDFALGFVIPLHIHMGFDTILTDYLPVRKFGRVSTVATWSLRVATLGVLYGCYEFNTNDVGLTALVKRIWTGSL